MNLPSFALVASSLLGLAGGIAGNQEVLGLGVVGTSGASFWILARLSALEAAVAKIQGQLEEMHQR